MKKIVYLDMDNVLVDFQSALPRLPQKVVEKYADRLYDVPAIMAYLRNKT